MTGGGEIEGEGREKCGVEIEVGGRDKRTIESEGERGRCGASGETRERGRGIELTDNK